MAVRGSVLDTDKSVAVRERDGHLRWISALMFEAEEESQPSL
jgi:hypothetical protein